MSDAARAVDRRASSPGRAFDRARGVAGVIVLALALASPLAKAQAGPPEAIERDVVVVGASPAGLMAAIGAARGGSRVIVLERTEHIGGLPANGLGATDIATVGATGGLFSEFARRVREHYVSRYGADSPEANACRGGLRFEPHVAEQVFEQMIAEQAGIEIRRGRQFDAMPSSVAKRGDRLVSIATTRRATKAREDYRATVFIDATYEGDLAAAAGARFRLGREGAKVFGEQLAGKVYMPWNGEPGPGSTFDGDEAIQAYNFRPCLTADAANRVDIPKPSGYRREEYVSLLADIRDGVFAGKPEPWQRELQGVGRVVVLIPMPRGKFDANNQHQALISTDLPEENWQWPTADWGWRDRFANRLREYELGLLWFVQHDEEVPEPIRRNAARFGLAADEFVDNQNFPRQVYVREARRLLGEYTFTARDALPTGRDARPPVHSDSITASHYPIDSHPVRKREPGRVALDGMLQQSTAPYTVPFGVIVPIGVDGLLVPVAVSASHLGYGTLRMEPSWMGLGHAAGVAAALAVATHVEVRNVRIAELQRRLLEQKAVLVYFRDIGPADPRFPAVQYLALRGALTGWAADLEGLAQGPEIEVARHLGLGDVSGTISRASLVDLLRDRVFSR